MKSLQLTSHGDELMRARGERRTRRIRETLERLSPDARQQVLEGLRILVEAFPLPGADNDVSASG